MNNQVKIKNQSCPNKNCPCYGSVSGKNIRIHSKRDMRYQCAYCKKTWVAHRGDMYYGLRAPKEKIDRALRLYDEGKSVREIAREVGVSPSTVQRWSARF